jgi:hypothetical protein
MNGTYLTICDFVSYNHKLHKSVNVYVGDYRWGIDLLTDYTFHLELRVIIALLRFPPLYKPLAHVKSSKFLLDNSWQRFPTVEILELPALRSSCHSRPCRT